MANSAGAQSFVGFSDFNVANFFSLNVAGKLMGGVDSFAYGALIYARAEETGNVETIMGNLDGSDNGYDLLHGATPIFTATTGDVAVSTDAPPDPLNVGHKAMLLVASTSSGTTSVYMNGHLVASTGSVTLGASANPLRIGLNNSDLLPNPLTAVGGVFFALNSLTASRVNDLTRRTQQLGTIAFGGSAGETTTTIDYIWNARENVSSFTQAQAVPGRAISAQDLPETVDNSATWGPSQMSQNANAFNGDFDFVATADGGGLTRINIPNVSWY